MNGGATLANGFLKGLQGFRTGLQVDSVDGFCGPYALLLLHLLHPVPQLPDNLPLPGSLMAHTCSLSLHLKHFRLLPFAFDWELRVLYKRPWPKPWLFRLVAEHHERFARRSSPANIQLALLEVKRSFQLQEDRDHLLLSFITVEIVNVSVLRLLSPE